MPTPRRAPPPPLGRRRQLPLLHAADKLVPLCGCPAGPCHLQPAAMSCGFVERVCCGGWCTSWGATEEQRKYWPLRHSGEAGRCRGRPVCLWEETGAQVLLQHANQHITSTTHMPQISVTARLSSCSACTSCIILSCGMGGALGMLASPALPPLGCQVAAAQQSGWPDCAAPALSCPRWRRWTMGLLEMWWVVPPVGRCCHCCVLRLPPLPLGASCRHRGCCIGAAVACHSQQHQALPSWLLLWGRCRRRLLHTRPGHRAQVFQGEAGQAQRAHPLVRGADSQGSTGSSRMDILVSVHGSTLCPLCPLC